MPDFKKRIDKEKILKKAENGKVIFWKELLPGKLELGVFRKELEKFHDELDKNHPLAFKIRLLLAQDNGITAEDMSRIGRRGDYYKK